MRSTYNQSPLTEAQAYALDSGYDATGRTLIDYEKHPRVADQLLRVRSLRTRERWTEMLNDPCTIGEDDRRLITTVWDTLAGDTCFNDALRLIARKV